MKKNFINIIIIFTILMFLFLDIAYASSVKLDLSQYSITVGEYTITAKVSDLDVGENGINALTATVDIPSGIFEDVTSANFTGLNNWTASYTADTKKLTLFKSSFTKDSEDIFTIKLKSKSSSTTTVSTVKLTNIIVSNGEDEFNVDDVSIQLGNATTTNTSNTKNSTNNSITNKLNSIVISNNVIKTNNTTKNNTVNNVTLNISSNNANTSSNYINKTFVNNTSTNSTVPYTGTRETVRTILIILMIGCAFIYYRIQKMNKIC